MSQGIISPFLNTNVNKLVETLQVYFRPSTSTDTVKVGQVVSYNSDISADYKERTTQPSANGAAYAEGSQNYTGRFTIAEQAASGNIYEFVGIVTKLGSANGADGDLIEVCPLVEGAVVPVYTDANCTINETVLGVATGSYTASAVTGDGDPLAIGVAAETVDRSGTNGLVWCRLFGQLGIGIRSAYFYPTTYRNGRSYGIKMDATTLLRGTTAAQAYLLELTGDKEAAYDSTGDAYSAYLHISGSNYAQNDSNYTYRGLNCSVANRSGGTLGSIYGGNISISLKSGSGNITNGIALQVDAQDLTAGTKTDFGGIDVAINREGTAASGDDFGIRIRTRGTINTAINTVFQISKDATDHGFTNLFNIEADGVDYEACTGDVTVDANDKVIPIVLGGTTYYLIAVDSIP